MMTQPRKNKRKNDDYPDESRFSILSMIATILRGMWRYGVVAPARAIWHITQWALEWGWAATKWTFSLGWQGILFLLWIPLMAGHQVLRGLNWLINGTEPEFETVREREIYRRIHRRYRRRNFFMGHVSVFLTGMVIIWYSALIQSVEVYPIAPNSFIISLLWGCMLIFHYFRMRSGNLEDEELRDALDAEYARQQQERPYYEEEIYTEYPAESHRHERLVQRLDDIEPDTHEYENHVNERKQKRRG